MQESFYQCICHHTYPIYILHTSLLGQQNQFWSLTIANSLFHSLVLLRIRHCKKWLVPDSFKL